MSLRETLTEKPVVGIGVAAILVAVAGVIAYRQFAGGPVTDYTDQARWFYDLETGKLFPTEKLEIPPITAPSGGEGVEAVVLSCGQCGDPAQRQIVYLISTHPENDTVQMVAEYKQGEPPQWTPFNSERGMHITGDLAAPLAEQCGQPLTRCTP